MKATYDYLIVGAGLFGAVFAHEATRRGKRCLVIDKRQHTGGNIYCKEVNGIQVHYYGAHIFHTDNRRVWDYVNRLVEFNRFTNSPLASYGGKLYNLPFNMNTFYQLWGVRTPAEARARIEEERARYAHIGEPLPEAATASPVRGAHPLGAARRHPAGLGLSHRTVPLRHPRTHGL